jgi:hypothetical protein
MTRLGITEAQALAKLVQAAAAMDVHVMVAATLVLETADRRDSP